MQGMDARSGRRVDGESRRFSKMDSSVDMAIAFSKRRCAAIGRCSVHFLLLLLVGSSLVALLPSINLQYRQTGENEQEGAALRYSEEELLQNAVSMKQSTDAVSDEQRLLSMQRHRLTDELNGYSLHPGLGVRRVEELIPHQGGKPVITLLVTSWRFGSTITGELLNVHPATFYYYEPLHHFGVKRTQYPEETSQAVTHLSGLFRCDGKALGTFLDYALPVNSFMLKYNKRLWRTCQAIPTICSRHEFVAQQCKQFPFILAKTVRLRMEGTELLLRDNSLSLKVVLLVRDPRGALSSRSKEIWCKNDCIDPASTCRDLVSDHQAALRLTHLYPGRIMVLRYEDLSPNQLNRTRAMYDFLSLSMVPGVENFINAHNTKGHRARLVRNSTEVYLGWRDRLTFQQVDLIQSHCREAMDLFGYRIATESDDLHTFDPVGPFTPPT